MKFQWLRLKVGGFQNDHICRGHFLQFAIGEVNYSTPYPCCLKLKMMFWWV